MNTRNTTTTDWIVTRDDEAVFSGDETAARGFFHRHQGQWPQSHLKLYAPPTTPQPPPAAAGRTGPLPAQAIQAKLVHAREGVLAAVRSRSNEALMPALESLVQAKILSVYVEDGGLIDKLRLMRAALEAINGCIAPSDRAKLDQPGEVAYVRVAVSAEAYQKLRDALKSLPE